MTDDETDQPTASETKVPEAELVDRRAHELLLDAYANGSLALFSDPDLERLSIDKKAGNRLVAVRLASILMKRAITPRRPIRAAIGR